MAKSTAKEPSVIMYKTGRFSQLLSVLRLAAYGVMLIFTAFGIAATIVISITLVSYHTNNQVVTDKIHTALSYGTVAMPPERNRDQQTGLDTWTDCLVLEIATFPHHDIATALTSAENRYRARGVHPCDHLSDNVGPLQLEKPRSDYWRYWWGSASLLNIALDIGGMDLSSYKSALKSSCYVLILIIGITALARYRRAAVALLPILVALFFGFGLPLFGQSIANAPSLIIGMLLLLLYIITGIDRTSLGWQFVYLFNVGALVCYFDLMNGHLVAVIICFAFVRVISIHAFGLPTGKWPFLLKLGPTTTALVSMIVAYCMGAVSIVFLRILLRSTLLEQNISTVAGEWLRELSRRTANNWTEAHLETPGSLDLLHRLYYDIDVGSFPYIGRHATVLIYAVCGLVYLIIVGWLMRRSGNLEAERRDIFLAVSIIVMIVPLWYGVFLNHTLVHFWLTGRLLALFFSLALSIAALVIFDKPVPCSLNR